MVVGQWRNPGTCAGIVGVAIGPLPCCCDPALALTLTYPRVRTQGYARGVPQPYRGYEEDSGLVARRQPSQPGRHTTGMRRRQASTRGSFSPGGEYYSGQMYPLTCLAVV
ncbi:MAG: hypothetical protein ACE5H7_16585, partial [Acidiferrobacterales bacterium]